MPSDGWRPDWDAPDGVLAWMSTRQGGVSAAPFDSLNLARSVAGSCDHPYAVAENRRRFSQGLGAPPGVLPQVHGTRGAGLGRQHPGPGPPPPGGLIPRRAIR